MLHIFVASLVFQFMVCLIFLIRSQLSWREGLQNHWLPDGFFQCLPCLLGRLIVSLRRTSSQNCPGCISRLETMLSDLVLFGWVPASKSRSLGHSGSHCRLRASNAKPSLFLNLGESKEAARCSIH